MKCSNGSIVQSVQAVESSPERNHLFLGSNPFRRSDLYNNPKSSFALIITRWLQVTQKDLEARLAKIDEVRRTC